MEGRRADQGVRRPVGQLVGQALERREKPSHSKVGIHALLEPAAMGRASFDHDLDPHVSLVGPADSKRGRFGDDRRVGPDPGEEIIGPEASILFVGHRGDDEVAPERRAGSGQRLGGRHARGQASLHVVGAATVQPAVPDLAGEWLRHPGHIDRVQVRIQHQTASPSCAGEPRGNAGATWNGFEHSDVESGLAQPVGNVCGDLRFSRGTGSEGRVDGIDADEPGQSTNQVVAIYRHSDLRGDRDEGGAYIDC
jgi:hypothetical protein